jgi:exodeoxyribonuclease VII large subunit
MARARLDSLAQHRVFRKPFERIQDHARKIDDLDLRAGRAVRYLLERSRERLRGMAGRLESLSPLGVLERGYSLTWRTSDEALVTDTTELEIGQSITTRLARGTLTSCVERISTQDD